MGKHSITATVTSFSNRRGVKSVAAASVAGTLFGIGMPAAFAAPQVSTDIKLPAQQKVVATTVSLAQEVKETVVTPVEVEVNGNLSASAKWDLSEIDVEVEEIATPEAEAAQPEARPAATRTAAQTQRATAQAETATEAPEADPAPVAEVASGSRAGAIVAGALAQLGRYQDCTALVENALRSAGYAVGDLGTGIWQYDFLGPRVSLDQIQPGDILVYGNAASGAHVAIYIGNGQAVHGGFNGGNTVIYSIYVGQPLTGAVRPM